METKDHLQKKIYKDAEAAIKWLNKKNVNNNQIIIYGESLEQV